jgi:hypothetical protein
MHFTSTDQGGWINRRERWKDCIGLDRSENTRTEGMHFPSTDQERWMNRRERRKDCIGLDLIDTVPRMWRFGRTQLPRDRAQRQAVVKMVKYFTIQNTENTYRRLKKHCLPKLFKCTFSRNERWEVKAIKWRPRGQLLPRDHLQKLVTGITTTNGERP